MHRGLAMVAGALLTACQQTADEGPAPEVTNVPSPAPATGTTGVEALPVPKSADPLTATLPKPDPSLQLDPEEQRIALAASQAPQIYMAIQEDGSRPLSIVFAIDESRDGTPQNDPAIRLTPDQGACNPQAMRNYSFPSPYGDKPVFGADQVLQGVNADQLPAFLAIQVSEAILERGLVGTIEETRPQNICARKLWEAQLANPANQG